MVLHGAGGRVGHVDGPQRRAGPGDRADVDEARRVERVNRQVGAVHRAEHLLARIPQAALAPDVLLGAAGGARRLQEQIAADEEQHFPAARCALDGVGDTRDRLEHAEPAQTSAVVESAPVAAGQCKDRGLDFLRLVGDVGAEIRLLQRAQEPRTIRRQVLDGSVARRDDGAKIAGTELIDHRGRNPLCGDRRLTEGNRPIEQDDHHAAFFLRGLIRGDVARHDAHPRGVLRPDPIGQVDLCKSLDLARLAVFENAEVFRRQPADRTALPIQHRHVDLHQIGATSEQGALGRTLSVKIERDRGDRGDDENAGGARHSM